jgi:hypothetical protein
MRKQFGPSPRDQDQFQRFTSESEVRKLIATILLCFCGLFLSQSTAHAQQIDVAFGANTLTAPPASSASGDHFPQSLTGGFYPTLGGDVLFFHHLGIGGEVSWRASRSYFQGLFSQPYRPVFYDFNAIYAPPITHQIQLEFQGGVGAESIRFYQNFTVCSFTSCTNYVSSNHFLGHFGAAVRFYPWGNFFIRPEAGVYLVNNNLEFSSAHATRFGIAIGYTLGSH